MKVNFLDIILIVLFFQLLTLVPFLFFHNSGKGLSNKILGIFLLAKAICITNFLGFRLYNYTYSYFPHLFYLGSSFTILWGPTLYLYIKSLTEKDFRFRYSDIIHALPFLIHFLFLTSTYHIHSADVKREIMLSGGLFSVAIWNQYYNALHIYTLIYTIAAFLRVRKFHCLLKGSYSSFDFLNLSWMNFVLFGFLVKWSCDVCYHLIDKSITMASVALITSRITLFLFVNMMIYKGLKHPFLFLGKHYDFNYKKQSLSDISKETYLEKLLNFMERERPHLNPDLTLEQLSKLVAIPPRSLTIVLNECLNQNFYDFINSYRVKESARMLLEKTPRYKTVLEVLFEAGFNNKSSFNTAFKKYNGVTPTEFRRLQAS